jgi:hypothetical protein
MLGITRDSVLKMDSTTKEVLITYPLKTVKRWAASPTSFTVDFGGHQDKYPTPPPPLFFLFFVFCFLLFVHCF